MNLGARYLEVSSQNLIDKPVDTLSRIFSFMGEVWSDEARDALANASISESWKTSLSEEEVTLVETSVGEVMRGMGFN